MQSRRRLTGGTSMGDETLSDLSRETGHPNATRLLTAAFFWNPADPSCPFGNENGMDTLLRFRDFRDEHPRGSPLAFLDDLLEKWEVKNEGWDLLDPAEVQAIGEDDEFSFLTRDEVVVALAFAQAIADGRIEPEIRRRALIALKRQLLPSLLDAWSPQAEERAERVKEMVEVLNRPWR